MDRTPQEVPLLLNPPALNLAMPAPKASGPSEITGSITRAPSGPTPKHPTESQPQPPVADRLPVGIAGPQLRGAALAGDAGAAYEIALRFVEARGVSANLEEAARWFERAASKGLTPAQFRYASMLEKGQGVKKDLTAAQKLYIAAAGKGHAKAIHNLAGLYAEGIDGKPDYANAAQWFRKAAELGVADSQYNLGVLAARGLGTERNIAEAYKWFALAAAQGDREAGRKRDEVAAHLDPQALEAAQQAVKKFTPAVQPPAAITVPAPVGGWDRATPSSEKPRAAGPLSISAFNSGKL
jgi:localization factor PodJL